MARSTKEAWLKGPGDLKEADVEDVPVKGETVRVRGLPAKYSAEVSSQMKMTQEGREQVARVDVATMEVLQFAHGVIDPTFTQEEALEVQKRFGPAFRKVIEKIDELSGIDKEALENAEQRFPVGGEGASGANGESASARGGRPVVPVRDGA